MTPGEKSSSQDNDLFPTQVELEGSTLIVPEVPGLGVDFDEKLAGSQKFKYWEAPHLRRRDGSYTNW